MDVRSYEDIAAKAEWEGGLDEALDWFKPEEVPEEIREAWRTARDLKTQLQTQLGAINAFLPEV
jgi:hypothetical protein